MSPKSRPPTDSTLRAAFNSGRSQREVDLALEVYDSIRHAASASVVDFETILSDVRQITPALSNRTDAEMILLMIKALEAGKGLKTDQIMYRKTQVIHIKDLEGGVDPQSPIGALKPPPEDYTYIGRPGKWGNPYVIGQHGSREECIAKYEKYIMKQRDLIKSLPELAGKRLGCFCHPKPCHGDVLVKLVKRFVRVT